jgi:hypothetical protein
MFDVVGKVLFSVFPAMLDALVVKHLRIVIEADTLGFVVINQSAFPTDTLNEPDRRRITDAEVPCGMRLHIIIRTDLKIVSCCRSAIKAE